MSDVLRYYVCYTAEHDLDMKSFMRESVMNVTPLIPDGYNGPTKQLTCRICKHVFYLTQDDYHRLSGVSFCHECNLILLEELQKPQEVNDLTPSKAPKERPVVAPPPCSPVQPSPPVRIPQPRTIDRGK